MGLFHSPRIVTDGLVLALDGGNIKSYPYSGTTWTDLSGKGNNGTLTNGATFSLDNGGAFEFDGTDDYINCGSVSDVNFGTGDFAVECWFFDDGNTVDYAGLVVNYQSGADINSFQFGKGGNSNGEGHSNRVSFVRGNTLGSFKLYDSTNTIQSNTWTHAIVTRIGTTVKLYVNGVEVDSMTDSGSYSKTDLRVGVNRGASKYWSGKISNVKLYKGKGLTATEVAQNYNAIKSRYSSVWSLPETTTGTIFDFTGGSLPSGMYQDSDGPTVTWGASSVELAGDAPNNGASYPLRVATSFTGDYLFQLSTRIDVDPSNTNYCSDAGIGLFNTAYNTSNWTWKWGVLSGRIAAQNNCDTPTLYGHTNTTSMSSPNSGDVLRPSYVADGGWITMHLYHEPSQSRTRYKVTLGEKDWDASGTQIGDAPNSGVLEVSDSFSGTYYVGISADDDSDECHMNAFRYVAL